MNETTEKIFIQTFGCQMNEHDTERIFQLMRQEGYYRADDPKYANLIILNTCSIREKPEHKVYSLAGRLRKFKKKNPSVIIGIGGCVAQQEQEKLLQKMPYVDLIFGTHNIDNLPDIVRQVREKKKPVVKTDFLAEDEFRFLKNRYNYFENRVSSFVTIMNGCDNFCSYCIVPYVRGREVSRSYPEIEEEITMLVGQGIKEVTLLGQNVNSYGNKDKGRNISFEELLEKVHEIKGLERLRFVTSHPKDISERTINLFSTLPKLCNHLHLPVQSGSDKILRLMERGYDIQKYYRIVERLKSTVPDFSVTTDIIVGFPHETEEDFEKTLELVKKVNFDGSYSFKYSVRPGTKAEQFPDTVEEEIKQARLLKLQQFQENLVEEKNISLEGRIFEILVEGPAIKDKSQMTGRTTCNRIVNFRNQSGEELSGKTVKVKILRGYKHSLLGEIIN